MRILVDGYNLAHASTWLGLKGAVREPAGLRMMILHLLAEYVERTSDQVTIIFDGLPADAHKAIDFGRRHGIEVFFSGHEVDADTQIEKMLSVMSGAREVLVVSSDRAVRAAAGRRHAKTASSGEFFHRVQETVLPPERPQAAEPPEKSAGVPDHEVALWMRLLGLDEKSDES